jgi:hypothetical protein
MEVEVMSFESRCSDPSDLNALRSASSIADVADHKDSCSATLHQRGGKTLEHMLRVSLILQFTHSLCLSMHYSGRS